jgi:tetratricopeptide (TPR) repeat protein
MLTLLTVHHHQRKDVEKTLIYAAKTIELLANKRQPENLKPEEWDKKRSLALGNAHYLTGVIYSEQERFAEADRSLRAALPHIKYDDYVRASALFHLGWANYKMGEQAQSPSLLKEALHFNSLCASIKSPFRQQALKNLEAIRLEYDLK